MRKFLVGICAMIAVAPAVARSKTVWFNERWTVDKRDAQNDEDDYSCRLVGKSASTAFAIGVSAQDGSALLEFPLQEGQRTPPSYPFTISLAFDDRNGQRLQANHSPEFDVTTAPIGDLTKFLEKFASSKFFAVTGGIVDRTISLKGSRAASSAFLDCLGRSKPTAMFVNSEIYYGSRVGMSATVIGEIGLNSGLAEIRIKHTHENAKAFCEGYVLDTSEKCVNETMAEVKFESDRVYGNCQTGEFVDMSNGRFRLEGKNHDPSVMADFRIRSLRDDTILDGSSASGYGTALSVLKALCPDRAKKEAWN
ncbi:MAG: hypothetical protein EOP06_20990 [Proteobacteria bacterium]|nr:MAG: hypothetical protein EOP06_20990 [Pseudomonadota bacterium]